MGRLISVLISILGVALALAGAVSLGNGIPYLRLDWGATEIIAGSVALAGGCVTLALGAVLFALRDLARSVAQAAPSPVGVGMIVAAPDVATAADEPRPAAMSRFTSKLVTVGLPKADRDEPSVASATTALGVSDDLDGSSPDHPATARPDPGLTAHPTLDRGLDQPGGRDPPISEPPLLAPTVVGRYDANGASYVLFSDGTIEVETENGTHRFGSMADLKDHIERQDAG